MLIIFLRTQIEKISCCNSVHHEQEEFPGPLSKIGESIPFATNFIMTTVKMKVALIGAKLKKSFYFILFWLITLLKFNTFLINLYLKNVSFSKQLSTWGTCPIDLRIQHVKWKQIISTPGHVLHITTNMNNLYKKANFFFNQLTDCLSENKTFTYKPTSYLRHNFSNLA